MMIEKQLEKSIEQAFLWAQSGHYEFLTLEMLLFGVLQQEGVQPLLQEKHIDTQNLINDIQSYVEEHNPRLNTVSADNMLIPQTTSAVQRVLQRAAEKQRRNRSGEDNKIGCQEFLFALLEEDDSYAAYFLLRHGVNWQDVQKYVHNNDPTDENDTSEVQVHYRYVEDDEGEDEEDVPQGESLLVHYAVNLNALAGQGKIDPIIGREQEIDRLIQTLCRRKKNNPLLVGEAGVGKTAIVEGLARLIVAGQVPPVLEDYTIYSLDVASLIAGTKYRGEFEARLKKLLKELETTENAIIFIDEIHTIIGAGSSSDSTLDIANLLKPALSSGTLHCIGATTYDEYRKYFDKQSALSRRFQKIDVEEPSTEDSISILQHLKPYYERFHQVRYSNEAIRSAVELSQRFINERYLPDKAIDLIDEAGAICRVADDANHLVVASDIEHLISRIARIPEKQVSNDDKEKLRHLESTLRSTIFGQDEAISALSNAIKLARAGLNDPERPTGSFLLVGPTGVGKTEVCKQLAQALGVKLLRFDMSEYMEAHSVSRLIGAPPGYVGYSEAGQLSDQVLKNPYSVVLMDEIEKAHPDVISILLQIMDYGKLTDSLGRDINFRNVILILTSNAGAAELEKNHIGFTGDQVNTFRAEEALKRYFTPEFRNRLNAIIHFKPLQKEHVVLVVDKLIAQLQNQLKEHKVHLRLSPAARQWLADRGYDAKLGARPLARLIERELKRPLAESLLFGDLRQGGEMCVEVKDGALIFCALQGERSESSAISLTD